MKKITPHLWFDKEAREAAEFYVAAFRGDSAVTSTTPISDTPSGNVEVVAFRLLGHEFMSISAGPLFRINPSISFLVNFDPAQMGELMGAPPERRARVVQAFLKMKKFDIVALRRAYDGKATS